MFQFYGTEFPCLLHNVKIGGVCPHCAQGSKFTLVMSPDYALIRHFRVGDLVASYICEICLKAIPIRWLIYSWVVEGPQVVDPQHILRSRQQFDFEHVSPLVRVEVEEALACLSVNAYNGFAALCRRAVQAICTDLGAAASTKIQRQIEEMSELTGLPDEFKQLALQIMLTGHDGAHPHLPEVGADRATVLLSLLEDLVYELYTRPGKVRQATALRQQAIGGLKDPALP